MLIKIAVVLIVLVVVLIVVIALRPSHFRVERSVTMAAPPQRAFELVNDLRAWGAWSPYEKKDPQMTRTFDGPATGVGAVYAWAGNGEVGAGRMTIEQSDPASKVGIKLEFTKPFTATNAATFTFTPVGEQTKVTWAMEGEQSFVFKALSLVMNMDKMVGNDFEQGLLAMKSVVERGAPTPGATAMN